MKVTVLTRALLLALAVAAVPAATASADHEWKTWHFNMAGNSIHDGNATVDDEGDPVRAIRNSLTGLGDGDPKFVGLNEICENQFDRLLTELRQRNTDWNGQFVKTVDLNDYGGLCDRGGTASEHDYGNAVFVRGQVDPNSRQVVELPHPDYNTDGSIREHRKMICVTATLAVWVRTCTTHIDNNAPDSFQDDQIRTVKDHVEGLVANGKRVVLTGDFNVQPGSDKLDRLYSGAIFDGGAHGVFEEVDQGSPACRCGAATHSSGKIDFTWVNSRDWTVLDGSVHNPTTAHDHEILRGRIRVVH